MTDLFTHHPASVGESYAEHLSAAGGFGLRLMIAGLACLVHAIFPFLFVRTGSKCVADLHERMVTGRIKEANEPAAKAHSALHGSRSI